MPARVNLGIPQHKALDPHAGDEFGGDSIPRNVKAYRVLHLGLRREGGILHGSRK